MVTNQVTEAGRGSAECLIVVTDSEILSWTQDCIILKCVIAMDSMVVSSSEKVVEGSEGSSSKLAEVTAV